MKSRKFIDIFIREAEEHLALLRQGLLTLEADGASPERVHDLLRSAHTLKGSAMMLGLDAIGRVAHAMEDLFKDIENGQRPLTATLVDILLAGTDALEILTAQANAGDESDFNIDELIESLRSGVMKNTPLPSAPVRDERETEIVTVRANVERLDQLVNQLGEVIITRGAFEERGRQLRGVVRSLESFVRKLKRADNVRSLRDIQGQLTQLAIALEADINNFSFLSQELHHAAMELRMLPLSTITEDLGRMARTLARDQGKELTLTISGDQVELDRMMLEALKPMLLHMLRNSVDHGIEEPEERQRAGKSPGGRIELSARYEAGFVRIVLKDDGRGIDPVRVRRVAVSRGLLSETAAAAMDDDEAIYLILQPGFSTREFITDVSGRGVGMDVVKTNVDKVKGDLVIHSTLGQGTEMHLQFPLTMALITGLMIDCEGMTLAVPLHYVTEILRLGESDILTEGGHEVVRIHGRTVPLISLADVLQLPPQNAGQRRRHTALVLTYREQQLACLVSSSFGVRELVVKSLGKQLKSIDFFSGVTILGDGLPVLILAIPDLFAAGMDSRGTTLRQTMAVQTQSDKGRVLVVDDSITTRTMEKNILEAHGYRVTVANCGDDALEKLAAGDFDLIVSDVEMPGMNGFELTARLRQMESTRETPVIIVTSLASDEHRRKGLEVGAQAYIVKGNFDQGTLLETVETLIG